MGVGDFQAHVPIKWRTGPPPAWPDSLYQFVREYLWQAGGSCTRTELLKAMTEQPAVREKLEASQGFSRLLINMRHSRQISVKGDLVRATAHALLRGRPAGS